MKYEVIEHTWIPMADGMRLSVRLWLPISATPVPAVLEYLPYRKRDLYRAADNAWGQTLASDGFAFARVDVRGTGDSEGTIDDEYSKEEVEDGVQVIHWLSTRDWCSGAVGMRGISWGAINSLLIAARQPPALRAIVAMAGTDNRQTDDAHFIGNTVAHTGFQWGTMFKGVLAAPPDPTIVGAEWREMWQARLRKTPAILARWLSRRTDQDYWQPLNTAAIRVPTYLVAGWQDMYANPILRILASLRRQATPTKAVVGPWGHTTPQFAHPIGLNWRVEELRWWSHWLRDESNGVMASPTLQCYMPYGTARQFGGEAIPGRWVAEANWPRAHDQETVWYLAESALHTQLPPTTNTAFSVSTGVNVGQCKPDWLDRAPLEQSFDDERSVLFDSAPLLEAVEILGAARMHCRVSSALDHQIAIRLCDVDDNGHSWLVATVVENIAASQSSSSSQVITLTMPTIAHHFTAGHRLRVACSSGLWPLVWPAQEPATARFDDARLVLPTRRAELQPHELDIQPRQRAPEALADYRPIAAKSDQTLTLKNATQQTTTHIQDTDTSVSREGHEESSTRPGEHHSARWYQESSTRFERADWRCAIRVGYELSATQTHFRLREWVRAENDGAVVHEQEDETLIPR